MKVGRLGGGDAEGGCLRGRGDEEMRVRSSARV